MAALGVAAGLFVAGCETGGDDPGEESAITGNSNLRVVNNSDYETTVYFDGSYVGSVSKEATRTWRVPSGSHEVKFDNADVSADSIQGTYNFPVNGTWTITVTWEDVLPNL